MDNGTMYSNFLKWEPCSYIHSESFHFVKKNPTAFNIVTIGRACVSPFTLHYTHLNMQTHSDNQYAQRQHHQVFKFERASTKNVFSLPEFSVGVQEQTNKAPNFLLAGTRQEAAVPASSPLSWLQINITKKTWLINHQPQWQTHFIVADLLQHSDYVVSQSKMCKALVPRWEKAELK